MSDPSVAEPTPDPTPSPTPDPAPEPAPTPDPSPDPAPSGGDNVVWPEDWREKLSGDDKKVAEELGRYAEPGLIGPALVEAKNKIRSADIRTPFPDEASDKDKAKWRKDNGVPKDAAGYFDKLPEGIDIKEEDKAGMETLASAMHAVHAPPEVMNAAMGAYYTHIENAEAQLSEMDKDSKKAADDALHELYGGEFRRNINDFGAWLGTAGKEVKDKILSARMMPSGTPLGNDPEVVKWLIGQMREINPVITVPGLGAGEPGLALTDEIAKIEKTILTDNRAYRGDPKMQARYLELIAARDSHKGPDARK